MVMMPKKQPNRAEEAGVRGWPVIYLRVRQDVLDWLDAEVERLRKEQPGYTVSRTGLIASILTRVMKKDTPEGGS